MPQIRDHTFPVLFCFIGICISAGLNLISLLAAEWLRIRHLLQMLRRWTDWLRSDVLLPLSSPFFFMLEYYLFIVLGRLDVPGFFDNSTLENIIFLALPALPFACCVLSAISNIIESSTRGRTSLFGPRWRIWNADEFARLRPWDSHSDDPDRPVGTCPYSVVLWSSVACLVITLVMSAPWLVHLVGLTE
jgi:hypothetical protein